MSTRITISVDGHDDADDRNRLGLLESSSPDDREFEDLTPTEIQSNDIAAVKQALESTIGRADYLLALVGDHANRLHDDRAEIGEPNWQWWEIKKAKELGKKLVGVKLDAIRAA